jgi:esterase
VRGPRPLALGLVALLGGACQYMPHAYQPHSPQIPDARTIPLSSGAILTFTREGSGPAVVFVHGSIADLRIWAAQRGPAFQKYQLVAYSRRYHYPNAWNGNGSDYTDANHDADLLALVRELQLGRVHLVGHGVGGRLALEVALAHPEVVRSLTLVEPLTPSVAAGRPGFDRLAGQQDSVWAAMEAALRSDDADRAAKTLFDWENQNPGAYDALPPPFRGEIQDNAHILPFQLEHPGTALTCAQLGALAVPLLVVSGARSNLFFGEVADAVAACVPGARRETIPSAAHVVQRENPDAFNAALVGFLATH